MDIGNGSTLVQHSFENLIISNIDKVVVVTGKDASSVSAEILNIQNSKSKIVFNPKYKLGMTTSIQVGLKEVLDADAIMVCLSDMPLLSALDYDLLIAEFKTKGSSDQILAPFRDGKKGNPVIFGAGFIEAIQGHQQMNGCASIIEDNWTKLIKVEVDNECYFVDVDTQEDLKAIRKRVK